MLEEYLTKHPGSKPGTSGGPIGSKRAPGGILAQGLLLVCYFNGYITVEIYYIYQTSQEIIYSQISTRKVTPRDLTTREPSWIIWSYSIIVARVRTSVNINNNKQLKNKIKLAYL